MAFASVLSYGMGTGIKNGNEQSSQTSWQILDRLPANLNSLPLHGMKQSTDNQIMQGCTLMVDESDVIKGRSWSPSHFLVQRAIP